MKKIISLSLLITAVAGAAFYGGLRYDKSQSPASAGVGAGGRGNFQGRQRDGGGVGNFTGGPIISMDDKSVTVQTMNGGSKIVFFSGATKIMKSVDGSPADLATGKQVTITGTANPDGSMTAETIQLRTGAFAPRAGAGVGGDNTAPAGGTPR
jgi:hypothetical protein